MKILRVTGDLYPEVIGGVGLHAHQLSVDQVKSGHEVTVLTSDSASSRSNPLPREEELHGYRVLRAKSFLSVAGNPLSIHLIPLLAKLTRDTDIVHAHSHLFYFSNGASVLSRINDKPFVITVHGVFSQSVPMLLQRPFMSTVGSATMRLASCVICLSNADRAIVENLGVDTERLVVIPEGVDCELFHPPIQREHGENDAVTVLFVGRLVPGKGIEQLLRGCALACENSPNLFLRILGDGPLRTHITQTASDLGISDSVTMYRQVSLSGLVDLYQQSDIFALTSFTEGMPKTILEAMACGLPIIASFLPQTKDLIQDVGVVVNPRDPYSISRAILRLAKDKSVRVALGAKAREKALQHFDWKIISKETTKLLKSVA